VHKCYKILFATGFILCFFFLTSCLTKPLGYIASNQPLPPTRIKVLGPAEGQASHFNLFGFSIKRVEIQEAILNAIDDRNGDAMINVEMWSRVAGFPPFAWQTTFIARGIVIQFVMDEEGSEQTEGSGDTSGTQRTGGDGDGKEGTGGGSGTGSKPSSESGSTESGGDSKENGDSSSTSNGSSGNSSSGGGNVTRPPISSSGSNETNGSRDNDNRQLSPDELERERKKREAERNNSLNSNNKSIRQYSKKYEIEIITKDLLENPLFYKELETHLQINIEE
jgi:hypothetical protein